MTTSDPSKASPSTEAVAHESAGHSKRLFFLVLILLAGGLLRLAYFVELLQAPDFALPQFESQYHDYWARALVTGDWTPPEGVTDPEIRARPYFRPPGYPLFLASIYQIFGLGYALPRLLQMLLGLFNVWLIFKLAEHLFEYRTALVAAALMATSWILIFFEGEFMALALLISLLLTSLNLLLRSTSYAALAISGLLIGAAAVVRPNILALVPLIAFWWFLHLRQQAERPPRVWARTLAFCVAAGLVVLPVTLRNFKVEPDGVLITSNAGINLFIGTHPESDGYTPGVPELGEWTGLTGWDSFDYPKIARAIEAREGREMTDAEISSWFSRRAIEYSLQHPWTVVRLLLRKGLLFWGPHEISNNKILALERRNSGTLKLGLGFAPIFGLALFGLIVLWIERHPGFRLFGNLGLMGAVIVIYFVSFLPFFAAARFRVPLIPFLILFGAYGLSALGSLWWEKRWKRLSVGTIILVALLSLTQIAWIPYEPDAALWHLRRGLLYRQLEKPELAVVELRKSVELAPDNTEARFALADELARMNRFEEATQAYRAVLYQRPDWVMAHNNLATNLAKSGDLGGAIDAWEQAIELDPRRLSILNNLALALATRPDPAPGDRQRAVALAEAACQQTEYRQPALMRTLVLAYQEAGQASDAERLLERLKVLSR